MLSIRPVQTRAELKTFITLPRKLYRGLPGYVAPLDFERRQLLDPRKAKFFEHAQVHYWIAYEDERPVGRISAQVDRLAIETWGTNIGCFGCLDAIDDANVVKALCETAAEWLRERGMTHMRGPFTLSINGESGVQISGQERGSMVLMPWHPGYLAGHIAAAGLTPAKDLLAYTVAMDDYHERDDLSALAKDRLPPSLSLRTLDLRKLDREGEILRAVYNEAWKHNWSYVPITEAEISAFVKGFRPFLIADCGLIAELDGKPIAVAVLLPNLFETIAGFDGRLLPFNWISFARRAFRISSYRSVRLVLFGVIPHLHRIGAAVAFTMLDHLLKQRSRFNFDEAEMGWVLEDNRPTINLLRAFGAGEPSKRYRMFERELVA